MDNKYHGKFMITQAAIEPNNQEMKSNKQGSDEKTTNLAEYFKEMIASSITSITDHINTLKSSPTQKDLPNTPDPTTVFPDNRRNSPLDGG